MVLQFPDVDCEMWILKSDFFFFIYWYFKDTEEVFVNYE